MGGGNSQVGLILSETQLALNKTANMEDSLIDHRSSQAAHSR